MSRTVCLIALSEEAEQQFLHLVDVDPRIMVWPRDFAIHRDESVHNRLLDLRAISGGEGAMRVLPSATSKAGSSRRRSRRPALARMRGCPTSDDHTSLASWPPQFRDHPAPVRRTRLLNFPIMRTILSLSGRVAETTGWCGAALTRRPRRTSRPECRASSPCRRDCPGCRCRGIP